MTGTVLINNILDDSNIFTESIIEAQLEADKYTDILENNNSINDEKDIELKIPKLLNLPQDALQEKTADFKSKNAQLDLLLLKAESYSKFILQNQRESQILTVNDSSSSTSLITGKRSGKSAPKISKKISDKNNNCDNNDSSMSFTQPASLIGGKLMSYQLEGLRWLLSLWENGLSGILADEMGLGKTIQIISLVAKLRELKAAGPFLIAGPLATLMNWIKEFKKWCPSCPVILYHGNKEDRAEIRRKHMPFNKQKDVNFPVVITSFEICLIDRPQLEKYSWQYVILDEGHRIKNRNCRLVKELKQIKSTSRLLLTGTPIQNSLEELWSLLNFCSPTIFDDLEVFQSWFGFRNIGKETHVDEIIETEKKENIITKLHEILRPFLLRRLKKDVLISMPPKKEFVVYCGLSIVQQEYYNLVCNNGIRDALLSMGIENACNTSQINMTMNLRKVCNHPFLFGEPKDEFGIYIGENNPEMLINASGKFKLLDRMLPNLKNSKSKVLIFSQMTELLDILEDYLLYKSYDYCRLDGSTKIEDRQIGIEEFNSNENKFVFLLSTRAGGLGINLTSADTVILFDSDWNPHQDSQAQDRCHRIGQTKPVCVYRLITSNSVEIEMMEKQISKKKLERMTVIGGDFRKAGQRSGSQLTLAKLRTLLADDVNISRMNKLSFNTNNGSLNEHEVSHKNDLFSACISDDELSLIMNRNIIFSLHNNILPNEGIMFDVVNSDTTGCLGEIN